MSAQPVTRDVPPPGAPEHWAHMPWRARQQWLARQARERRDDGRPRDAQGRRIWTDAEQLAGNRAVDRWRTTGKGPRPTLDQYDAWRAYKRGVAERLRRAAGAPPRESDEDRARRSESAKAAYARHRFGRGAGEST